MFLIMVASGIQLGIELQNKIDNLANARDAFSYTNSSLLY